MIASECGHNPPGEQGRRLQRPVSNTLSPEMERFLPELPTRNVHTVLFLHHLRSTDFLLSACGEKSVL